LEWILSSPIDKIVNMKTALGVVLGILTGLLTLAAIIVLLIYLYLIPAIDQYSSAGSTTPTSTHSTSTATASPPTTTPIFTPGPTKTTLPPQNSTPLPNDVNFVLNITGVTGENLSRTVTAEITNTGSIDAQNTWAKIEVFSRGKRIKLNGEDYLRKDLGTLKAGAPASAQITLTFNPLDAPIILTSGARLYLTIYSDQKTQNFSYDYVP
jgi:hypothetical protein